VWLAQPDSETGHYIAVFNTGDQPQAIEYAWKQIGLSAGAYQVRDLWEQKTLGIVQSPSVTLQPVLYRVMESK